MKKQILKIFFVSTLFLMLPNFSKASTTIDATVVCNKTDTSQCFISSGFPLPEGLVTEQMIFDGKIKILVNSVEVAANVSALRGRHNDGTLRSMLIQFNYPMAQGATASAQVIVDNGVRTLTDPAYVRPTYDMVVNNNIIVPSDNNYLVTTGITLRGLIPEGEGSVSEERFYTDMAKDRYNWMVAREDDPSNGTEGMASYDHVSAILSLWARSGEVKYQEEAVKWILRWLPYNTPTLDPLIPVFPGHTITNPDDRTPVMAYISQGGVSANLLGVYTEMYGIATSNTSKMPATGYLLVNNISGGSFAAGAIAGISGATANATGQEIADSRGFNFKWLPYDSGTGYVPAAGAQAAGIPAEWYFPRMFSYAQMYLLTGYRDFWGIVAQGAQYQQSPLSSQSVMYTKFSDPYGSDFPRTNYAQKYGGLLAAMMIDATIPVDMQYGKGRVFNWDNQLTWTLDTLEHLKFNDPGQYWDGLAAGVNFDPAGRSGGRNVPLFQLVFPTNFMIDTYLYFKSDSRIPDLVQKMVDVELQSIRAKQASDVTCGGNISQTSDLVCAIANDSIWGGHTYVKNYSMKNPIDFTSYTYVTGPSGNATIPYELPEFARMLAFVIKTKGDSTINGFTYSQWYDKLINTGNAAPNIMGWQWKYFGQFYSWGMDAPWMMKQSSLLNYGPSSLRTPTQYNLIPIEVPDVERNYSRATDVTPTAAPMGLSVQ